MNRNLRGNPTNQKPPKKRYEFGQSRVDDPRIQASQRRRIERLTRRSEQ